MLHPTAKEPERTTIKIEFTKLEGSMPLKSNPTLPIRLRDKPD